MERETAIEILKALWRSKDPEYEEVEIRAAISEAIEALKESRRYELVTIIRGGFNGNQLWQFCPNCGASMRKEGEAE